MPLNERSMSTRIVTLFLPRAVFPLSVLALTLSALPRARALDDFRDAAKAPPSWGRFAKLVNDRFDTWLAADDEVANRFRAYVTLQ